MLDVGCAVGCAVLLDVLSCCLAACVGVRVWAELYTPDVGMYLLTCELTYRY